MMDSFFAGTAQRRKSRPTSRGAPFVSPKSSVSTAAPTAVQSTEYRPVSPLLQPYTAAEARKSLVAYIDADNYSLASSGAVGGGVVATGKRSRGNSANSTNTQAAAAAAAAEVGFFASVWALGRVVYVTAVEGSKEVVNDVSTLAAGFTRKRRSYAMSMASSSGVDEFVEGDETTTDEEEGELTDEDDEESEVGLAERAVIVGKAKVEVVERAASTSSSSNPDDRAPKKADGEEEEEDHGEPVRNGAAAPESESVDMPKPAEETPKDTIVSSSPRPSHITIGDTPVPDSPKLRPIRRPSAASSRRSSINGVPLDEVARLEADREADKKPLGSPVEEYSKAIVENMLNPNKGEVVDESAAAKKEDEEKEDKLPKEPVAEEPKRPESRMKDSGIQTVMETETGIQTDDLEEEEEKKPAAEVSTPEVKVEESEVKVEEPESEPVPIRASTASPQRYTSLLPPVPASPRSGDELSPPTTPTPERRQSSRIPVANRRRAASSVGDLSRELSGASSSKAPEPGPSTTAPRRRPTLRSIATDPRLSWLAGKNEGLKFDADGKPIDPEAQPKRPMSFLGVVKKAREQQLQQQQQQKSDPDAVEETPERKTSVLRRGLSNKGKERERKSEDQNNQSDTISVSSSLLPEKRKSGMFHLNLGKKKDSESADPTATDDEKKPSFLRRRGTMSGGSRPASMFVSPSDAPDLGKVDKGKGPATPPNPSPIAAAENSEQSPSPRRRRGSMAGLARPLSMFVSPKDAPDLEPTSPVREGTNDVFVADDGADKEQSSSPRRRRMSGLGRPLSMFASSKDAAAIEAAIAAGGTTSPVIGSPKDGPAAEDTDKEKKPGFFKRRPTLSGASRPSSTRFSSDSISRPAPDAATPSSPAQESATKAPSVAGSEKEKKPGIFKRRPTMSGMVRPVSGFFGSDSTPTPAAEAVPSPPAAETGSKAPSIAGSEKEKKPGFFRRRPTMSGMSRPSSSFFGPNDVPAVSSPEPMSTPRTPSAAPSIAESEKEKKPGFFRRRPTMTGAIRPSVTSAPSSDAISIASSRQSKERKPGLFRRSTNLSTHAPTRRPGTSSGPSGTIAPAVVTTAAVDAISVAESAASSSRKPGLFRKNQSSDATPTKASTKMRGLVRAATFMGSKKKSEN